MPGGFMTLAPLVEDPEDVRYVFANFDRFVIG